MMDRVKKYASFYRIAHHRRVQLYHLKWRLFFILLTASAMVLVYEYLQGRYPYGVYDAIKGVKFLLSERIFEWFSIGVIFGVVSLAIMYEGEFIFGVRKLVHHFEGQTREWVRRAKNRSTRTPLKKTAHQANAAKKR